MTQGAFDPAGIEDLAVRHRAGLMRYFLRRTRKLEIAEDFTQETFARLLRLDRNGEIQHPVRYMFKVAASVLQDHARRSRTRAEPLCVLVDQDMIASEDPTPERVAEARDNLLMLKIVLDELPEKTRDIFLANRLDGLSYQNLAMQYGVSASAIEKHMMRAIAHLQQRGGR